jgi:phage-related protein
MSVGEEDPPDRPVVFLAGTSIKTSPFTEAGRIDAGMLLRRVQDGEAVGLPESRPMPSIGPRCHELRVRDAGHYWRIVYRVDPGEILVVHIFPKSTQKTPKREIDLCRKRLAEHDAE